MSIPRLLAFAVLAALACRSGDAGERIPPAAGGGWTLEPVAEALPADAFMRVVSLAADASGNLYVGDKGASSIRVFDSAGREVRTLGRSGAGPGEFADLYSLAWSGDTLAVYDPGNGRIELVGTDGVPRGSWPGARITGGNDVRLHQAGPRVFMPAWRPGADGKTIEQLLVTIGPDGAKRDTLRFPPKDETADPTVVVCELPGGGISFFDTPFTSHLISAVSPAGELVLARSREYRLAFFDGNAQPQRFTLYGATPVPIATSEWDSVTTEYRTFRERFSGAKCEPDAPTRPAARPALRAIEFDDEGRMWVEATVAGGYNFHIYDAAGGMLANIPAPDRDESVPFVVRGRRLYVVSETESGEQLVRMYRIGEGPGS